MSPREESLDDLVSVKFSDTYADPHIVMIQRSCDVFKYNNVDAKLSIKSLELEDGH